MERVVHHEEVTTTPFTGRIKRCCWGECKNNSRRTDNGLPCSFLPFPKPFTQLQACEAWLQSCGRPHLSIGKITNYHYVCSQVSDLVKSILACSFPEENCTQPISCAIPAIAPRPPCENPTIFP
jgi:hypothetical protein